MAKNRVTCVSLIPHVAVTFYRENSEPKTYSMMGRENATILECKIASVCDRLHSFGHPMYPDDDWRATLFSNGWSVETVS